MKRDAFADTQPMELLKSWRTRRFMTQKDLAARIGVPYQTVQRWESGRSMPQPRHLGRLCEALGVQPEELLTKDELAGKKPASET